MRRDHLDDHEWLTIPERAALRAFGGDCLRYWQCTYGAKDAPDSRFSAAVVNGAGSAELEQSLRRYKAGCRALGESRHVVIPFVRDEQSLPQIAVDTGHEPDTVRVLIKYAGAVLRRLPDYA